jgi:hypothetical protein
MQTSNEALQEITDADTLSVPHMSRITRDHERMNDDAIPPAREELAASAARHHIHDNIVTRHMRLGNRFLHVKWK